MTFGSCSTHLLAFNILLLGKLNGFDFVLVTCRKVANQYRYSIL